MTQYIWNNSELTERWHCPWSVYRWFSTFAYWSSRIPMSQISSTCTRWEKTLPTGLFGACEELTCFSAPSWYHQTLLSVSSRSQLSSSHRPTLCLRKWRLSVCASLWSWHASLLLSLSCLQWAQALTISKRSGQFSRECWTWTIWQRSRRGGITCWPITQVSHCWLIMTIAGWVRL